MLDTTPLSTASAARLFYNRSSGNRLADRSKLSREGRGRRSRYRSAAAGRVEKCVSMPSFGFKDSRETIFSTRLDRRSAVAKSSDFPAREPGGEFAPRGGLDLGELIAPDNQITRPVALPGRLIDDADARHGPAARGLARRGPNLGPSASPPNCAAPGLGGREQVGMKAGQVGAGQRHDAACDHLFEFCNRVKPADRGDREGQRDIAAIDDLDGIGGGAQQGASAADRLNCCAVVNPL
jgi:hypothetical protein